LAFGADGSRNKAAFFSFRHNTSRYFQMLILYREKARADQLLTLVFAIIRALNCSIEGLE
jgi:hypothetical protein